MRRSASPAPRAAGRAPVALGLLLAAAAFLGAGARAARAAEAVILVADRLDRADLWESPGPHLARLRREAACGLLSTRFLLSALPEGATIALGAGSSIQYEGSYRWRGGGTREDAAAYQVNTGRVLPPGALACLEIERLCRYSNAGARPGALGTVLRAAGKRTACLGNADLPGRPRRQILSLLMDEQGLVDAGDVGPATLAADPSAPGGLCVNVAATLRAFTRAAAQADVVAIDFGDTSRLIALKPELSAQAYQAARAAALARLDALVGGLRARIDARRTLFLLVSPAPPFAPSVTAQVLSPVFLVGPRWHGGVLVSPTTRQPGAVANADIAATLAAHLGVGPLPGAMGQPLRAAPHADVAGFLRDMDAAAQRVCRWRYQVFGIWAALLGLATAAALAALALRLRPASGWGERLAAPARAAALLALAMPLGMYLVAGLAPASLGAYVADLFAATLPVALAAAGLARVPRGPAAPVTLFILTALALLGDSALGAPRQWRVMMGYGLTDGTRYYGIGNEYMAILIGLALVALACRGAHPSHPGEGAFGKLREAAPLALGVALGLLIGHPSIGANFGGALSAAAALGTAAVLFGKRPGRWAFLVPVVLAAGVGAALIALDLLRPAAAMSHVGRGVGSIEAGGWAWAADVIARKARLNSVLMGRTPLTGLFFLAAPPLLVAGARRPAWLERLHPALGPLLTTGVAGSVAAFLLNDSGIVAGALLLVCVLLGAGYVSLEPGARGLRPEREIGAELPGRSS